MGNGWLQFWTITLIGAGGTFAVITIIVGYKGVGEVKELIRDLTR